MYTGTTPVLKLKLDTNIDLSKVTQMWVTIRSLKTKLTKKIDDLTIDSENKTVYVNLSQEDTLGLSVGTGKIQIRFLLDDDRSFATTEQDIDICGVLEGGMISE